MKKGFKVEEHRAPSYVRVFTFSQMRQLSEGAHTEEKRSIRTGFSFQLYDAVLTRRTCIN